MTKQKVSSLFKTTKGVVLIAACLLLTVLLSASPAQAAKLMELSTAYPGISAAPGETITFPLDVRNNGNSSQIATVELKELPEQWKATLRGNSREIQKVFVRAGSYESVDLKLEIPEDIPDGDYSVTVVASSEGGQKDTLPLQVRIAAAGAGDDELVAQYSELKGPADATFKFQLNLTNHGSTEQTYSLGAQAPDGWQISFKPSYENQQVASISVKPGSTQGIDVEVTPSSSAEAGQYTIPVQAVSAGGPASAEITVVVSGSYVMQLTTPTGRLNADTVAGRETKVNLEMVNNGSAELNNIGFSALQPPNWSVEFEPKTIDTIPPGEKRQVIATITPAGKAIAGDYVVSLMASTRETTANSDLRVTVKTSTLWGIVGVIIVLLVIGGVQLVFKTYGRR